MPHFLYGIYPYVAISGMIIALIARYERDPFTWKSKSSQVLRRRHFIVGSVLFHVGVLVILAGYFAGLLTPIWVFDVLGISRGAKQILAVVAGGIAGVMALVGGGILLDRRQNDPRIRASSSFADTAILALLIVQLLLGLGTIPVSLQHLDGHEMTTFMARVQGILSFRADAADQIADASWIFKTHIFLGLTIFLLFPFTRLVHIISVPVRYLWRPGYQIVRTGKPKHPAE